MTRYKLESNGTLQSLQSLLKSLEIGTLTFLKMAFGRLAVYYQLLLIPKIAELILPRCYENTPALGVF